jgi:hypothetical protein
MNDLLKYIKSNENENILKNDLLIKMHLNANS